MNAIHRGQGRKAEPNRLCIDYGVGPRGRQLVAPDSIAVRRGRMRVECRRPVDGAPSMGSASAGTPAAAGTSGAKRGPATRAVAARQQVLVRGALLPAAAGRGDRPAARERQDRTPRPAGQRDGRPTGARLDIGDVEVHRSSRDGSVGAAPVGPLRYIVLPQRNILRQPVVTGLTRSGTARTGWSPVPAPPGDGRRAGHRPLRDPPRVGRSVPGTARAARHAARVRLTYRRAGGARR